VARSDAEPPLDFTVTRRYAGGRPRKLHGEDLRMIEELRANGHSLRVICRLLRVHRGKVVSPNTILRHLQPGQNRD
jgi:hypothetical protein